MDPQADATWRHWDQETVVHHRMGNDTHRLAEPAGWILERLSGAAALTIHEIAAGGPCDATDLTPALAALTQLGLITRC